MRIAIVALFLMAVSPDGTMAPPSSEIVDAQGRIWRPFTGDKEPDPVRKIQTDYLLACGGSVYAQERTSKIWYKGTANGPWTPIGTTRPC